MGVMTNSRLTHGTIVAQHKFVLKVQAKAKIIIPCNSLI